MIADCFSRAKCVVANNSGPQESLLFRLANISHPSCGERQLVSPLFSFIENGFTSCGKLHVMYLWSDFFYKEYFKVKLLLTKHLQRTTLVFGKTVSSSMPTFQWFNIYINPNSLDNKGSCWILKDFYYSVTMLRELELNNQPVKVSVQCTVQKHEKIGENLSKCTFGICNE